MRVYNKYRKCFNFHFTGSVSLSYSFYPVVLRLLPPASAGSYPYLYGLLPLYLQVLTRTWYPFNPYIYASEPVPEANKTRAAEVRTLIYKHACP